MSAQSEDFDRAAPMVWREGNDLAKKKPIANVMRPYVKALMANPGRWAEYPKGTNPTSVRSLLSNGVFFGLRFEARKIEGVPCARFVGAVE